MKPFGTHHKQLPRPHGRQFSRTLPGGVVITERKASAAAATVFPWSFHYRTKPGDTVLQVGVKVGPVQGILNGGAHSEIISVPDGLESPDDASHQSSGGIWYVDVANQTGQYYMYLRVDWTPTGSVLQTAAGDAVQINQWYWNIDVVGDCIVYATTSLNGPGYDAPSGGLQREWIRLGSVNLGASGGPSVATPLYGPIYLHTPYIYSSDAIGFPPDLRDYV